MDSFNNEIRIVLVGKTGTGKSSTGNTILNRKEFKTECQGLAVTDKASLGTRKLHKTKLVVVDTPGFLDTHRDSEENNKEIMKSIVFSVPGPHAILYVMRIGDRRNDDEQKYIRMFTDMFGEHIFKFLIIIFTNGNELEGKSLNHYFQEATQPFHNLFKKCSYRMLALDNKGTDCEKIEAVDNLLGMIDEMTSDRQTYYTCEMLISGDGGLRKRQKEITLLDTENRKIENTRLAYKDALYTAAGVGGIVGAFATSAAIASCTVAFIQVAGPIVVAAKVVGSVVGGTKVKSSDVVDEKDSDCAIVPKEPGGLFSKCSIS